MSRGRLRRRRFGEYRPPKYNDIKGLFMFYGVFEMRLPMENKGNKYEFIVSRFGCLSDMERDFYTETEGSIISFDTEDFDGDFITTKLIVPIVEDEKEAMRVLSNWKIRDEFCNFLVYDRSLDSLMFCTYDYESPEDSIYRELSIIPTFDYQIKCLGEFRWFDSIDKARGNAQRGF